MSNYCATPRFKNDPIIAAICAELNAQGFKFVYSETQPNRWLWHFDGRLTDRAKFVQVLNQHMTVDDFVPGYGDGRTTTQLTVPNHTKFKTGSMEICNRMGYVVLWMHR